MRRAGDVVKQLGATRYGTRVFGVGGAIGGLTRDLGDEGRGGVRAAGSLGLRTCGAFRAADTVSRSAISASICVVKVNGPIRLTSAGSPRNSLELRSVLSGQVIGQLAGVTAAPYIRTKQLVHLLVDHIPDRYNYFVYFGSRSSQTARARAFNDLAVKRLVDNMEYVLGPKELRTYSHKGRALSS